MVAVVEPYSRCYDLKNRDSILAWDRVDMKPMKAMKSMKKKAMKSMKAMKPMKAMKSKIAKGRKRKDLIFRGTKEKTHRGLTKSDLIKNKRGRLVNKNRALGNMPWILACHQARKAVNVKGFCKLKKGTEFYDKAMEFYTVDSDGVQL